MKADVLVLGGGVAGMTTAMELAGKGASVVLVEREASLGGRLSDLGLVFPTMTPGAEMVSRSRPLLVHFVGKGLITVRTSCTLKDVVYRAGNYDAVIVGAGPEENVSAKAMVMATGMEPIDAMLIPEFGFGLHEDIITSLQMEKMLATGGDAISLKRPSDAKAPRSIVFVQCVGSRVERRGVRYCSNICCLNAIKNASIIRRAHPEVDVYVLYIDIRTHGRGYEAAYKEARRLGVRFIRGQPSLVRKEGGTLLVCGENTIMRELYEIEADLVVLSVGLRIGPGSAELLRSLGQSFDADGEVVISGPDPGSSRLNANGLFIAGSLEHPKDIHDSVQSARACALSVLSYLDQL